MTTKYAPTKQLTAGQTVAGRVAWFRGCGTGSAHLVTILPPGPLGQTLVQVGTDMGGGILAASWRELFDAAS